MNARLPVAISFLFVSIQFAPSQAKAQAAPEKNKIVCDHAAPPRGMHYVCKSQCDCHLEGKLKNDEDGIVPAPTDTPRVCSYHSPRAGEFLVCDSECQCKPYVAPKKKSKKKPSPSTH